ncbi:MAG TPA: hypothetical protein PLJ21_03030 [Pseudobdellovibrionaceae bacterium]|nr:hypothetical protein [Pseudobdellovibrionaceae bacterium]
MYKFLMFSNLFFACFANMYAQANTNDMCAQAVEMSIQLNSCNTQLAASNNSLNELKFKVDQLVKSINDPSNLNNLRQCQDSNLYLSRELEAATVDLEESERRFNFVKEQERDAWRFLERSTDYWECVLVDKKHAGTRLFKGTTERDAESQWRTSDYRVMFEKHGYYKFCNPVLRANNDDFPDDRRDDRGRPDDNRRPPDDNRGRPPRS